MHHSKTTPAYAEKVCASHAKRRCSVRCEGLPGQVFKAWTYKIARSASPPKADIGSDKARVCFGPILLKKSGIRRNGDRFASLPLR
jgi:hypothetical protein